MKISLNPIETTRDIRERYIEYLNSLFFLRDRELSRQAEELLNESGKFVKGPFLEITPPFVKGESISDLINRGVLSKEYCKVLDDKILYRPLYLHQQRSIENIVVEGRNIVVATGTGSGKTECFLIPILDYLMKQKEQGQLTSGVRAILIYPMNALANDQLARLRSILKDYPYITFGRYTGETEYKEDKGLERFLEMNPGSKRLKNELLSRDEMRENPPHILLTNYAMLEYLLLRPRDNVFFDGEHSDQWKFIVLDEAHSYKGAKGTEISMLLQRLKERVAQGEQGRLTCIATSATLGRGKEDYREVAEFASNLFKESFTEADIIDSDKIDFTYNGVSYKKKNAEFYETLFTIMYSHWSDKEKQSKLIELLGNCCDASKVDSDSDVSELLYYLLYDDIYIALIQEKLREGPMLLSDLVEAINKSLDLERDGYVDLHFVVRLVDIASQSKERQEDIQLLPARYHLFVKALEGAYVSLWPDKKLYLDRHEKRKTKDGKEFPVFELANCQRCGQEYLVGTIDSENKLVQPRTEVSIEGIYANRLKYFILNAQDPTTEIDEDDINLDIKNSRSLGSFIGEKLEEYILCTACGYIAKANLVRDIKCCDAHNSKYIRLFKVNTRSVNLNTCYVCGAHSNQLVKRFLTADAPTTEVLARTLYQNIPPNEEEDSIQVEYELFDDFDIDADFDINGDFDIDGDFSVSPGSEEGGRKLLVFSDNRQEAAFFATYLNLKYNQTMWRHAILEVLGESLEYDHININSVAEMLVRYGDEHKLFDIRLDDPQKVNLAYGYLMKEFLNMERNIGLEGLGMIGFGLMPPNTWGNIRGLQRPLGIDKYDMWNLYCILFDSLRTAGAVTFPKEISPLEPIFEPRNRYVYFKMESDEPFRNSVVLGWMPKQNSNNKRLDFIIKLLEKNGVPKDDSGNMGRKILKNMLNRRLLDFFIQKSYIVPNNISRQGTLLQMDYNRWNVFKIDGSKKLYRCDVCGSFSIYNIKGVCPTYRCQGTLRPYTGEKTRFTYYKDIYSNIKPIPMRAEEHTAQLTSKRATNLQVEFEKGDVNVLSCSTTFEMGVDVGQLEAIFMRNIPPETSNYIQRAGRAGRKTESTAFALTYAKRRSHDLTYFQHPEQMIAGKIKPPYIEKFNEKIIKRHIYSLVLSWFFRKNETYYGNVDNFIRYNKFKDPDALSILRKELNRRPQDLLISIKKIVPIEMYSVLEIDSWGWLDEFIGEDGVLPKAQMTLISTLKELDELMTQLRVQQKSGMDSVLHIKNTYLNQDIISFLASSNVIPKYGFPVDVVRLDVLHHSREAKSDIKLERDLKIAISEFAPGNEIIAAGRVWKPYALKKAVNRGWPTKEYVLCPKCNKIYMVESALVHGIENDLPRSCCGEDLTLHRYVKPEFGFSTNMDAPRTPGERRKGRQYSTQIIFDDYDDDEHNSAVEGDIYIGAHKIYYKYSSRGKLVLINQGLNRSGFSLCNVCGYIVPLVEYKNKKITKHNDRIGRTCSNTYLHTVHLGYDFITDVLELRLPPLPGSDNSLWYSLLYALLEGASMKLGIDRSEINGSVSYDNAGIGLTPRLILFDEVPGGAGHVKKISQNIEDVIMAARRKVSGICGCGEETSCYGCLRNYSNQLYHDILKRGLAMEYLDYIMDDRQGF